MSKQDGLRAVTEGFVAGVEQQRLQAWRLHAEPIRERAKHLQVTSGPAFFWSVPMWRASTGRGVSKILYSPETAVFGASWQVTSPRMRRDEVTIAVSAPRRQASDWQNAMLLVLPENLWTTKGPGPASGDRDRIAGITAERMVDAPCHPHVRVLRDRLLADYQRQPHTEMPRSAGQPLNLTEIAWDKPAKPRQDVALTVAAAFIAESPQLGISPRTLVHGLYSEMAAWCIGWQREMGIG